jgi:sulfur-oxidizing protein SoxB
MEISRRDFLQLASLLGVSSALNASDPIKSAVAKNQISNYNFNDLMEFEEVGEATLLHICDMHAHIKPLYWREPSTLISAKELVGNPGFICGDEFLNFYGEQKGSIEQYFDTYMNFSELAKKFGKMGGISHIKTVADTVRKQRGKDNVLFLDSGDTWQGTAVALKTNGEAIVKAQNYLGIDVMVGHWEFTYGKEQVRNLIEKLDAEFIAQNVIGDDPFEDEFEETIFKPYTIKEVEGGKIGIIGQAFPFTSTANPKKFTEGWSFGIRHETLQEYVYELRKEHKVDCVVVLSHDGFSVDQEIARKVNGIDFILSGHTHDPAPKPIVVDGTVIVIAGSHGKYIGRLDIDLQKGKVANYNYKLIPIASNIIPADKEGEELVDELYKPYEKELLQPIGKTKTLLYKRDTFYSTFDALIGEAIKDQMDSEIVFTPGYRWGTTVLPEDDILVDNVYEMTAITYPEVYTFELKGARIKVLLEDIADNVFNKNPLYQQGGDMSRLTGVTYDIAVNGEAGKRIHNIKINGKPLQDSRSYVISSWGGNLQNAGSNLRESKIDNVYDIVNRYIKKVGTIEVSTNSGINVLDYNCGCPKRV